MITINSIYEVEQLTYDSYLGSTSHMHKVGNYQKRIFCETWGGDILLIILNATNGKWTIGDGLWLDVAQQPEMSYFFRLETMVKTTEGISVHKNL